MTRGHEDRSEAASVREWLDILPQLVWTMYPDGTNGFFNKGWHDYIGTNPSEPVSQSWLHWVHPEDGEQIAGRWNRSLASGFPFTCECRLRHKSGEYRCFLVQIRVQHNQHQEVIWWIGSCTDIHNQQIRQTTLESDAKLQRQMLDVSIDCIKVIRPNGHLSTMNRSGCVALGVSEDSGFGMEWLPLLAAEARGPGKEALALARKGENARFPGKSQLPGKEPQYWDNLLTPLKDSAGKVTTIMCVSREVTLERKAQMLLRNSEERLRLALEAGTIGICDGDLITGIARCDERTRAAFGLRGYDEITMQDLISAVHPEDRVRVTTLIEAAVDPTGIGKFDADFRAIGIIDGVCRWLSTKGRVTFESRDGARFAARFSGCVVDITEKVLAEQELVESQMRAREVLERTTDAVFMLNPGWEFIYLNPNAARLIADGRDLLGKNLWSEFPELVNRQFATQYYRVMEEGISVQFEEFYPEPLNMWFEVHAYPMQDGIVVFFRDSTKRRKSEEALIRSEKLAAVGRLAASVSHEINNPLAAVTNLLYLMETDATLSPTTREHLTTAQEELARVSQIAIQSLRFYRQSTKASKLLMEDKLDSILGFYQSQLRSGSITVSKRYRCHTPIMAFEGELRQVFANIIGNAVDALKNSGRVFVRTRLLSKDIFGRDYVVVTIADTGEGMAPSTLAKSFEPFFSTKGITGSGLGLWVSKNIVDKHQGKIRVRSRHIGPNHGSVFMIWLPTGSVPNNADHFQYPMSEYSNGIIASISTALTKQ